MPDPEKMAIALRTIGEKIATVPMEPDSVGIRMLCDMIDSARADDAK